LRFRPPQPRQAWTGVKDATKFGSTCSQLKMRGHGAWNTLNVDKMSEDCLFLNIYSPAHVAKPLPVMVYFHAGEFRFGSSNDLESNFPYFAKGNVILVTLNCRLGVFGFAALDVLRSRDPSQSTGNYGMQDQRAALQWVQRSISAFGGDPHRVTIFGESSGGTSVGFHLHSKASAGLFHRAILESPGLTQSKSYQDSEENTQFVLSALTAAGSPGCSWPAPESQEWTAFPGCAASGRELAITDQQGTAQTMCADRADCAAVYANPNGTFSLLGCGPAGNISQHGLAVFNLTFATGRQSPATTYLRKTASSNATACLVEADPADLIDVLGSPPHSDTFETDAAAPTVDGVELSVPLQEIARGPLPAGVDVLGGSNLDEGTEFMSVTPALPCNASSAEYAQWALKQFGSALGAKVPALYMTIEQPAPLCRSQHYGPGPTPPPLPTSQAWQAAMRSAGDAAIMCRTRQLLQAHHEGNQGWWYFFTATPIFTINEGVEDLPYMGAFHGAEVPFVFGDPFEVSSEGEKHLSQAMGCYWANFAATGNPNSGPSGCATALSLPEWPAVGTNGDAIELTNSSISKRMALNKPKCDLFAKYP